MRSLLFSFLLVTLLCQATSADVGVLTAGARNVQAYGAKGDGVTDDTLAFTHALQDNRHDIWGNTVAVNVYVPPGRYLISSTLILWMRTELFGDWHNPPTLVLAPNSPGFQQPDSPKPFIVTAGGYKAPDNTTDWQTRTEDFNGSTNNTFSITMRDLNVEIATGNDGAWAIYWWCAQLTALRNVHVKAGNCLGCLHSTAWGGGSTIANCTFVGGQSGYTAAATSMMFFRDCTFAEQRSSSITIGGGWMFTFQGVQVTNSGPLQLQSDFYGLLNLLDCSFRDANGVALALDANLHRCTIYIENTSFDNPSEIPASLLSACSHGKISQWSSANVVNTRASTKDSSLDRSNFTLKRVGRTIPRPSSSCVNVRHFGAIGDGAHDDTHAIRRALAAASEIFFPPGDYRVSSSLILNAGQKLFGSVAVTIETDAAAPSFRSGSREAILRVNGRGREGVMMYGVFLKNLAPGGSCLIWNGDYTSVVMDCNFMQGGSGSLPPVSFLTGGGFFENGSPGPGSNKSSAGLLIKSHGPLWFYSYDVEHFNRASLDLEGASNIILVNISMENSPYEGSNPKITINKAHRIYGYGFLAGDWRTNPPGLIDVRGGRHIDLWNVSVITSRVPYLVSDNSSGVVITYSAAPRGGNNQQTLAGFVK
jgi:hypothetical protein